MQSSQKAYDLIEASESLCLTTYLCPAGKQSIGWGHTGTDVVPGMVITEAEALALLHKDVFQVEQVINDTGVPLTQGQFDALVDFTFNLGTTAFLSSTILSDLRAGNYTGACEQLSRWVYAFVGRGYKILPGLVTRRKAEQDLFNS